MQSNTPLSVVILAAGKGTRMKSAKAKVLHEVFYQPMLHHVLFSVEPLNPTQTVVIIGHQEETVRNSLTNFQVTLVRQEQQLGTGHAVQMTESVIQDDDGLVMILCGDSPLIRPHSLKKMYDQHLAGRADITVMTTILDNPTGYGRIISEGDALLAIVEEKETDDLQKKISEVNAGIYLVKRKLLFEALQNITPDNTQGEFYLTDIVKYSVSLGHTVHKSINPFPQEVLGVNSKVELDAAHTQLQKLRNRELMQQGITMQNSDTISVSPFCKVGEDTLLMANVRVLGNSVIGNSCIIESGTVIKDCTIGNNAHVGANCVLENTTIADGDKISPLTALK